MEHKTKQPVAKTPAQNAKPENLQMYWLAYNVALETDVEELMDALQIKAYTRWDEVKGNGHSGPHLNDEVWPAVNSVYMFVASTELEGPLSERVLNMRAQYPGEGVKLIVQSGVKIY